MPTFLFGIAAVDWLDGAVLGTAKLVSGAEREREREREREHGKKLLRRREKEGERRRRKGRR